MGLLCHPQSQLDFGFLTALGLGLGLGELDFGLELDNLMDMIEIFRLATMMCSVQDPDITETKCSVLTVYGKFLTNIFHFQSEA